MVTRGGARETVHAETKTRWSARESAPSQREQSSVETRITSPPQPPHREPAPDVERLADARGRTHVACAAQPEQRSHVVAATRGSARSAFDTYVRRGAYHDLDHMRQIMSGMARRPVTAHRSPSRSCTSRHHDRRRKQQRCQPRAQRTQRRRHRHVDTAKRPVW